MKVKLLNHRAFITESDSEELKIVTRECKIVYKRWNGREMVYEKTTNFYNEIDKSFPRALLWHIADLLDAQGYDIECDDQTTPVTNTVRLRPKSLPEMWDNQATYLENLEKDEDGIGSINSLTGTGKSRFILETILAKCCHTLIVVPTDGIKQGLAEVIADCIGANNVSTVLPKGLELGDKPGMHKKKKLSIYQEEALEKDLESPEMQLLYHKGFRKIGKTWKKVEEAKESKFGRTDLIKMLPVYVICANSIPNLPKEFLERFEMILTDEGHTLSDNIVHLMDSTPKAYWRYSFSATMWRDRKEDMRKLLGVVSNKVIFEELPKESIKKGRVSEIEYEMKKAPAPKDPMGFWAGNKGQPKFIEDKEPDVIFKKGIICNENRNSLIIQDALEAYNAGRRVLISVWEEAHAIILKKRLEESGARVETYFSDMDKKEKKRVLKEASLDEEPIIVIGTYAIGIGVDTKNIDFVIIADGRKSSNQGIQRKGRGVRKKFIKDPVTGEMVASDLTLKIIDYFDWFHSTLLKHSKARFKVHQQYYNGDSSFTEKMFNKIGSKLHRV